jgi:hypothetical protein
LPPISTSRSRNQNKSDTPSTSQIQTKGTPIPTIRRRNESGSRGAGGAGEEEEAYQVLVDDLALEVLVPAVMEALLTNEVTNVDVAEAGSVGEEGARRRLTGPRRPRHQHVRARPSRAAATVLRRHRGSRVLGSVPVRCGANDICIAAVTFRSVVGSWWAGGCALAGPGLQFAVFSCPIFRSERNGTCYFLDD